MKGRLEILKVHTRKVKLGPNVDLLRLARATPGFSGADLAAIINEAGAGRDAGGQGIHRAGRPRRGARQGPLGPGRKSRVIDEKEKIATAYHEAGHAVVQYLDARTPTRSTR